MSEFFTGLTEREVLKFLTFKQICLQLSNLSCDEKYKVAAIVITRDFRDICAIGYNGNYKGGPNSRDSLEIGLSGFLHAEENCLLHLDKPFELRGSLIMICTHKPCTMCAKRIVNSGIKTVLFVHDYDNVSAQVDQIFKQSEVCCFKI